MSKRIYVGNLPFSVTEEEIRSMFSAYGEVISVNIISDRETGRSRGFGFVEMGEDDSQKAISALDNTEFSGRKLHVNEARERTERTQRTSRYSNNR